MNDDVAFLFCVPENTAFHWLFCGHRQQGPYCMNRDYQCNIGITFDSGTFPYWLYGTASMLHWILQFARALVLLLLVIFVLSSGEGRVRPVFSSNFFAFPRVGRRRTLRNVPADGPGWVSHSVRLEMWFSCHWRVAAAPPKSEAGNNTTHENLTGTSTAKLMPRWTPRRHATQPHHPSHDQEPNTCDQALKNHVRLRGGPDRRPMSWLSPWIHKQNLRDVCQVKCSPHFAS